MFRQLDYVMIAVSDMSKSVKFYHDTLGLPLKYETKDWTEFQTGKTTLALHAGRKPAGQKENSGEMIAGTCSVGFTVPDIERSFGELQSRGVRFVMPPKARESEGIKLAIFLDPDGLPISLSETTHQTRREEVTERSTSGSSSISVG